MVSRAVTKFGGCVLAVRRCAARYYSAPAEWEIPMAKQKYIPTSGTYPKGFLASSVHVGIKASNTKHDDLALIASEVPCAAAGVFTRNRFQAAPVTLDKEILGLGHHHRDGVNAVIINSGCANAVTGTGGIEDAKLMSDETDKCLTKNDDTQSSRGRNSLVMSTGVIGQRLPISKIISQIPSAASSLGNSHNHWMSVAKAICTTDTFPKLISRKFSLPSFPQQSFHVAGMVKGAGMIHPNMGTLLSVLCTDAPVDSATLSACLKLAVDKSFNSISIDGDTSTNDTVLILANGAAASDSPNRLTVTSGKDSQTNRDSILFSDALTALTTELAQLVVRDGEGATKFVTIRVRGAPSDVDAQKIAGSIAKSPLVKTALYGRDANWGRILCAIGYTTGVEDNVIVPDRVSVSFVPANCNGNPPEGSELRLVVRGEPQEVNEDRAAEMLAEEDLEIVVDLGLERSTDVCFWTCDFSHEYVTINGDYRT